MPFTGHGGSSPPSDTDVGLGVILSPISMTFFWPFATSTDGRCWYPAEDLQPTASDTGTDLRFLLCLPETDDDTFTGRRSNPGQIDDVGLMADDHQDAIALRVS